MSYIDTYKEIGLSTEVMGADSWQQVQLLLNKLMECINLAEKAMQDGQIKLKCEKILRAEAIVNYLINCLDFNADKDLCQRLEGIYNHVNYLLFWANAKNDPATYAQVREITHNLIQWWTHARS